MKKASIKKTLLVQIDNEKVKKVVIYLLAFFIPIFLLVAIFIYLKVYPFGENMYLPVDAYGQYVNYLQYFRDLFYGDSSIIYSLGKSIGGEMYGLFAYYLISPYNFITLIFEKGNIPFAFDIILILKTATCSLTFYYYLSRRKKANFTNLIFSFMYAMSAYVITYGFNIMWLDSVIMLPLVIAGIDDIIEEKKGIFYIIALSIILITNYYIGFMICIFSAIYYIYRVINGNLKDKKKIFIKSLKFIIYSLCAVLIASVILIPAFIGIKDGRADFSFSKINLDKNFGMKELILKFFTSSFTIEEIKNNAMPPVFCGVLANFLVISYFLNSKIKIKEKMLSFFILGIFILSFYIKGINILWSIGNIPAWYIYRYAFCFSFIYIILAKKRI